MLISMAAISGCVAADATSDESQTAQALATPASAFVLSVSTDENPVKVVASGTATNSCPDSCNFAYIGGSTLTISTAAQNRIDCLAFTSWTGACAGQGATCTVVINSDLSTSAQFRTRISGCIPK